MIENVDIVKKVKEKQPARGELVEASEVVNELEGIEESDLRDLGNLNIM